MKKDLSYLKENRKIKERQRILNNFYTKQMKKGKTTRAVIFDKIALTIGAFIVLVALLTRIIGSFITSLLLGIIFSIGIGIYGTKFGLKIRDKRIEEFKKEYKLKLEEEKLLPPGKDLEDYIIDRYYDKKSELKSNLSLLSKDKILKFYILFIVFYLISYFVNYPLYYKIMAVISFVIGTIIGSYNLTEYIRQKDNRDLLN